MGLLKAVLNKTIKPTTIISTATNNLKLIDYVIFIHITKLHLNGRFLEETSLEIRRQGITIGWQRFDSIVYSDKVLVAICFGSWHKWSTVIQPRLPKLLKLVDLLIRAHENKTDLARLFRPAPWDWNKSLKEKKKTQSDYSICQSKTSIVTNRLKRSRSW